MSSLASQLASIQQTGQDAALDRKKRSKLHSVSFLYDAHYAATQDYESIYAESLDALAKLETLDPRFTKFRESIFSDTSVSIDRRTQSQEQNKNLDKTIDAFLSLLGPYWDLAISVKAAEWPLRRFAMNIYNAEQLLLVSLPYYDRPLFERVLYVIPKLPKIFQWLYPFKKASKVPSIQAITRGFTDVDMFNLYSKFISTGLSHHTEYRKQLVFYVGVTISALALVSSSGSSRLPDFIALVLESSSSLLVSDNHEAKVSAYSILAVLTTAVPLSRDVILASIDTILVSASSTGDDLDGSAFRCILKLYQNIQSGGNEPLPKTTLSKLPDNMLDIDSQYLTDIKEASHSSTFLSAYIRGLISTGSAPTEASLENIDEIKFSRRQLALIEADAVSAVRDSANADKTRYVPALKFVIEHDSNVFNDILAKMDIKIGDLEMDVQTTLVETDPQADEPSEEAELFKDAQEQELDEDLAKVYKANKQNVVSYLVSNEQVDAAFDKLQNLFLTSVQNHTESQLLGSTMSNDGSRLSFLLRLASKALIPAKARLSALASVTSIVDDLDPKKDNVSLIIPIITTMLTDNDPVLRQVVVSILESIHNLAGKTVLLNHVIYGPDGDKIAVLSPKDSVEFTSRLLEDRQMLTLDSTAFLKLFASIVNIKKLGPVVLAFYASHAEEINIPSLKGELFTISAAGCRAMKKSATPSEVFSDFLAGYLQNRVQWSARSVATSSDFVQFEKAVLDLISDRESNDSAIVFLESALSSPYESLCNASEDRLVQIFPTLKFEHKVAIVNTILDNGLKDDSSVLYDPEDVLNSLQLENDLFVELFKSLVLDGTHPQSANVPKRRRRSSTAARQAMKTQGVSNLAALHLRRVTVLLDSLFGFSSNAIFKASLSLLQLLFSVLDDLETLGKDGKLPVLYSQEQLALCMTNVINSLKAQNVTITDSTAIRADVIVSSIRSSDSPQVQNKLLLVISALASLSPELVLHSVMPIFTFMGAHTIRQDDEFSTHVVEETILCVVPALASTARSGIAEEVDFLLASFVSAFPHIPRHRRVRLFTTLARTLGSKLSIHLILFLCGQQYSDAYAKHKMANCSALIDFSSTFLQNFTATEQLQAAHDYLDLWKQIPDDVVKKNSKTYRDLTSRVIFGPSIVAMNKSELYNLRKGLVSYLRHSLVDSKATSGIPRLRLKVGADLLQQDDTTAYLKVFSSLIGSVLSLIDQYSNTLENEEILTKLYKLLGDLLSLLPIDSFSTSISSILTSSSASIQTKKQVTTLCAAKFELENIDNPAAVEGVGSLVPIILDNITSGKDTELSQASFDTLGSLFQRFGSSLESSLLLNAMSVAVDKTGLLKKSSPEVIVSSINCITSVVTVVGVKCIGLFPKLMGPLPGVFEDAGKSDDPETTALVQTSVLVLIATLVRKIPNFVTPNTKQFLQLTLRATTVATPIRNSVLNDIAGSVEPKVVLEALCGVWSEVATMDSTTVGLFLSALEVTVERLDKRSAVTEASVFNKFFIEALEFNGEFDTNTLSRIESTISKCGIQYVMKLNNKTYRPLFASIVRWAFDGEGASKDSTLSQTDRQISFFKFFNKLQESLQAIVTSYYSYLMESTLDLLNQYASGKLATGPLRRLIYISLASSFRYNQSEYWQANNRFDPISKSLCDQLVNEEQLGKPLVKAITALVQSTTSEGHNKKVCELLMSHMRSDCKPREKFWTVRTLKSIYKKVGESWLPLLPQLVPLIAELLEDDDEEVEMETRTGLAKVIERVMGEPLDKWLE